MAFGATLTLPTITGSHVDFPVVLKTADFPAAAIDGGANSLLNGGGDLRAYTDDTKATQLALEVVTFVVGGLPDIEIYVKIPTAATGNTIYIEADTSETVQPAVSEVFGRNAVWSDYESVLHLVESGNGTSGEFVDSSGNGVTGRIGRSLPPVVSTDHPWGGNWQQLDGYNDYIEIENSGNLLDNSDFTVQALWQNLATLSNTDEGLISNWEIAQAQNHFRIAPQFDGTNGIAFGINDGAGDNAAKSSYRPAVNDVVYTHMTASSTAMRGYDNGSQSAVDISIASDNQITTAKLIKIGTYYDLSSARSLQCRVGRVRLRKSVLSADWIATEHANMDAGSNWVTVGAWENIGGESLTLAPASIPTQENFGTPSLSMGPAYIAPTSINSTEALGSLTTTTQAFITALGLATNEAFGNAALSAGGVNLQPPSLLSSESFGVASVVAGAVSILASGIGSAEALGMATVQTGTITLQLSAIGSGEALGVATIVPGPVSINPASLPSDEALGDLTLLNGGALVSLLSIGSGEAIGGQTISPGAVNINPAGLNSAELLGTPQVVAGVYIVLPPSISSAEAHGDALIFNGSAIISPSGIVSGEQLGPVTLVGGADVIGWLTAKIEARATLQAMIKTDPALRGLAEVNRVH